MVTVKTLRTPTELLAGMENLVTWAKDIHMAYAWASSSGGEADHWLALPIARVRKAVIGVHFAQTEPAVLYELREVGALRIFPDTAGLFHPKIIIGTKAGRARCIVGSANFTTAAFTGNVELSLALSGGRVCEFFEGLELCA